MNTNFDYVLPDQAKGNKEGASMEEAVKFPFFSRFSFLDRSIDRKKIRKKKSPAIFNFFLGGGKRQSLIWCPWHPVQVHKRPSSHTTGHILLLVHVCIYLTMHKCRLRSGTVGGGYF